VTSEPVPIGGGGCPLCATEVDESATYCPECGWSLAGVDGRPGPYSRSALWWTVAGFVAVYVITLGIVALTH
jgi:hypothetical protein